MKTVPALWTCPHPTAALVTHTVAIGANHLVELGINLNVKFLAPKASSRVGYVRPYVIIVD